MWLGCRVSQCAHQQVSKKRREAATCRRLNLAAALSAGRGGSSSARSPARPTAQTDTAGSVRRRRRALLGSVPPPATVPRRFKVRSELLTNFGFGSRFDPNRCDRPITQVHATSHRQLPQDPVGASLASVVADRGLPAGMHNALAP